MIGGKGFQIYNNKFKEEIDERIREVEKKNMIFNKPNSVELAKIEKIVVGFVAKRGLKLYGGHALNYFMPKEDKIYDGVGINDYDLYCVNAEEEGKALADMLYKGGIEYVSLGVGAFGDNYKLFCSFEEIANFTGLPKELFDVIPTKKDGKSGILYVEPDYLKMDLRVSLVNPRISLWRWVKDYGRKQLLEKHYPFVRPDNCKWPELKTQDKKDVGELAKFVSGEEGKDTVYTGFNALHMYFADSDVGSGISLGAPKQIMTEVMTEDIKGLIDKIMKKFGDKAFIYKVEEDPLHILPKRFVVRGKPSGMPLLMIYSLQEICVPYVVLRRVKCVSVDYLMLYFQVLMYHSMMSGSGNGSGNFVKLYKCSVFGLDELRKTYLKKKGKTAFDDTMFKEHIIRCFGNFVNPYYETRKMRWEKRASGGTYIPAMANVGKGS